MSGPYQFGAWLVEPQLNRLSRGGANRRLEPRAMDVLTYLLARPGEVVSSEEILDRLWPGHGDPAMVKKRIVQIRRALGDDARRPQYIETISKRGYRTIAPVAPKSAARLEPWPTNTAVRVDGIVPGEVSTTLSAKPGTLPVLAVLPFDNLSGDAALQYFSDGVSEEILQTVSRTSNLKVIGRTSSFRFRGSDKTVHHVADQLGCSHVLDGAVRRSGTRLRVSAQLIDCASQATLWSDSFERELRDVFALQDEIAAATADALALAFAPSTNPGPIDPIAFDHYLKAKASGAQWLGASDADLLEAAVARAPEFAQAWAALAVTRAIEAHLEFEPERSAGPRARAIEAANTALRLDPSAGAAYAALTIVEPICGRFVERDALMANGLRVAPNDPVVLFWACRWRRAVGRTRDALGYLANACAIDPLWPQGIQQYAGLLWETGAETEATTIWNRATALWPDLDYLYEMQLRVNAWTGNWTRVDAVMAALDANSRRTERIEQVVRSVQRMRHWKPQDTERLARSLAEELERTGTLRLDLYYACEIGLTDCVFSLIDRADYRHLFDPGGRLFPGDFGLHTLFFRFGRHAFHRDVRFVKLCGRLGLCDYWVRTDRWPDSVDTLAPFYDFRAEAKRYVAQSPD